MDLVMCHGHPAIVKTKQRCRESVWWPGMDKHVEAFVSNCTACIEADKGGHRVGTAPLKPIEYPRNPWMKLGLVILGELNGLPYSSRFFIVAIDLHSKWPEGKAVSQITSNSVIEFLSDLFSRWGLPSEIITDNGQQFVSREFEMFLKQL